MKKSVIYSVVGILAAFFIINKKTQKHYELDFKKESEYFPIEEAGVPETDNPENANMVAEGSQFGVMYYNEVKEE